MQIKTDAYKINPGDVVKIYWDGIQVAVTKVKIGWGAVQISNGTDWYGLDGNESVTLVGHFNI